MRQTLLVQIQEAPDADCEWQLLAPGAMTPLQSGLGPLSEILEQAGSARIVALVPSELVLLTEVSLPIRQPAKLLQAAPYALEEQLAEDVDQLHFAAGTRRADGSTPIAVVSRANMELWLEWFGPHRAQVEMLLPDVLALPPESGQVLFLDDRGRCLVRTGAAAGFAVPLDLLTATLSEEDGERATVYRHEQAPSLSHEGLPLPEGRKVRRSLELLHHIQQSELRINLLQGAFAPRREFDQWLRAARLPAALAAGYLLFATVAMALNNQQTAQQLDRLQQQAQQQFNQAFPDITRIVDMRVQARQELDRLRGSAGGGGFLSLFSQSAPALSKVRDLKLDGVQFRDGSLYLSLSGSDLQALERLRAEFGRIDELKLDVQQAQAGTDGVQIRLKVDAA